MEGNCSGDSDREGAPPPGEMENVPVIIGRYRLSKTLGIGAFGKVKRELFVFRPEAAKATRHTNIR